MRPLTCYEIFQLDREMDEERFERASEAVRRREALADQAFDDCKDE